jgi:Domain of unknown function (DUF4440)
VSVRYVSQLEAAATLHNVDGYGQRRMRLPIIDYFQITSVRTRKSLQYKAENGDTMDEKTSNQANLQEVELQFFSSLIQSDHDALDRILTDDFILIDVLRGAEIDKTALLEVIRSGQLKFEAIEPSEVRLRLYRAAAIVTGHTYMCGRFGDVPFTAHSRYTHFYIQQEAEWRLASAQGTPIEPEL